VIIAISSACWGGDGKGKNWGVGGGKRVGAVNGRGPRSPTISAEGEANHIRCEEEDRKRAVAHSRKGLRPRTRI